MQDSPELEHFCHHRVSRWTALIGGRQTACGSGRLKELLPGGGPGSPAKEREEERGGEDRSEGEEPG